MLYYAGLKGLSLNSIRPPFLSYRDLFVFCSGRQKTTGGGNAVRPENTDSSGEISRQSQPGNMQMYSRGEENGPENRESGRDVVRGFESYHLRFMLMYSRG